MFTFLRMVITFVPIGLSFGLIWYWGLRKFYFYEKHEATAMSIPLGMLTIFLTHRLFSGSLVDLPEELLAWNGFCFLAYLFNLLFPYQWVGTFLLTGTFLTDALLTPFSNQIIVRISTFSFSYPNALALALTAGVTFAATWRHMVERIKATSSNGP